ncbi:putative ANTH domain, ENTH domain, ANTH domain superfamily protein [Dioscorea sansibarensis]
MSKLRRAISAVKDQTSISLAKFSRRSSTLEVCVLRATSHDDNPVDDRRYTEVLLLGSSSPTATAELVQILTRRITRTRNWIVALKALSLTFIALRDFGNPHFAREALAASHRGGPRLLDLSAFSDDSDNTSPWDFTAFVRTFALYLEARLECTLLGKLPNHHRRCQTPTATSRVINMKPMAVLNNISYWQKLLDRAIGMRPTGPAKTNRLILISLYPVIRESVGLYRDISDGLYVLLDNFFHLDHPSCVDTFHVCAKAAKQFIQLDSLYSLCKEIGVGRVFEYPVIGRISKVLLDTMQEFLKEEQQRKRQRQQHQQQQLSQSPLKSLLSKQIDNFEDHTSTKSKLEYRWSSGKWRSNEAEKGVDGWELVLVESASNMSKNSRMKNSDNMFRNSDNNPFLRNENSEICRWPLGRSVSMSHPTCSSESAELIGDPLASLSHVSQAAVVVKVMDEQQQILREQQMWIQNQNKIIAKNKAR